MFLNHGVEDPWESLVLQGDPTRPSLRKSVLNIHWKDWCWSSSTLATWYEEPACWKRPWCWERLKAGGEGDNRAWDDWMESPRWWTWIWVDSRSWWWTGKPGMLQSMRLQGIGHDWATELNWTSILAWKIPWTEELVAYSPWCHKRVEHYWVTEHAHAWREPMAVIFLFSLLLFFKFTTGALNDNCAITKFCCIKTLFLKWDTSFWLLPITSSIWRESNQDFAAQHLIDPTSGKTHR